MVKLTWIRILAVVIVISTQWQSAAAQASMDDYLARLSSESVAVRVEAAAKLKGFGSKALPALISNLDNGDVNVVCASIEALTGIHGEDVSEKVLPKLTKLAVSQIDSIRATAIGALPSFSSEDAEINIVIHALKDPCSAVVMQATQALGKWKGKAKAATSVLAELLSPEESPIFLQAFLNTLSLIGRDAEEAADKVEALLSGTKKKSIRVACVGTLIAICNPEDLRTRLKKLLHDSDPEVVGAAKNFLERDLKPDPADTK